MSLINRFTRYQTGLGLKDLFPTSKDGTCAGCDSVLLGRKKRWCGESCRTSALMKYYVIKGDTMVIRELLYRVDRGACRNCGEITGDWQADHILPVQYGGGGCTMNNFQTLCTSCHREKTSYNAAHCNTAIRADAFKDSNLLTCELGDGVTSQCGTFMLKHNFLSTMSELG